MERTDVLERRARLEERDIALKGYSIRTIQEDNITNGTWGYTKGLVVTDPVTAVKTNVCLFARGAVHEGIVYDILDSIAKYNLSSGDAFSGELTFDDLYVDIENQGQKDLKGKVRFINRDHVDKLIKDFNMPIEGQDENVVYFWVLIGDKNNLLPGQSGYEDFLQVSKPVEETGEDQVFSEFLEEK